MPTEQVYRLQFLLGDGSEGREYFEYAPSAATITQRLTDAGYERHEFTVTLVPEPTQAQLQAAADDASIAADIASEQQAELGYERWLEDRGWADRFLPPWAQ